MEECFKKFLNKEELINIKKKAYKEKYQKQINDVNNITEIINSKIIDSIERERTDITIDSSCIEPYKSLIINNLRKSGYEVKEYPGFSSSYFVISWNYDR